MSQYNVKVKETARVIRAAIQTYTESGTETIVRVAEDVEYKGFTFHYEVRQDGDHYTQYFEGVERKTGGFFTLRTEAETKDQLGSVESFVAALGKSYNNGTLDYPPGADPNDGTCRRCFGNPLMFSHHSNINEGKCLRCGGTGIDPVYGQKGGK